MNAESAVIEADAQTSTAPTVIPAAAVSVIVSADKDNILAKLAVRVAAHKPDVLTAKGRQEIRSLAADIASDKMTLIRLGKGLTEQWRKSTAAVNAECNLIEDRMDALKEQVRRPLTEFENAEKARVKRHEDALAWLQENLAFYTAASPSADYRSRLNWLRTQPPRDWQEFAQRAADVLADEIAKTEHALAAAEKREAEAVELARLRAEAEERARQDAARQQAERDARIAAEAAEKARRDAEAKAERERQETLRAAAEERARIEREAQAERDRIEAERKAAHDRADEEVRRRVAETKAAEARAEAAARKAETDRIAAEQKAKRDQEAAVAAERKRQDDERARAAREAEAIRLADERRAANLAHQGKINRAAATALTLCNITEDQAKAVVGAIARGQVPHVRIAY